MLADYFVLRRTRLSIDDLYRRGGSYEYRQGFNPAAIAALAISIAPNVPGFLIEAVPSWKVAFDPAAHPLLSFFHALYAYAWFIGFLLAGAVYLVLTRLSAHPSAPSAAARSGSRPST
jgi:NCS1 family nucleobase:cation symporter-1